MGKLLNVLSFKPDIRITPIHMGKTKTAIIIDHANKNHPHTYGKTDSRIFKIIIGKNHPIHMGKQMKQILSRL